ncbi:MAG: hypothetical protein ACREQL_16630 [Candidatus Binatia bacterium]
MLRKVVIGFIAGLSIVLAQPPRAASGAACVQACSDEAAACVSAECQGLTKRPLRQCKRRCKKTLVHDCYSDLSVCGATIARPPKPGGTGSGGQPSGGGW